MSIHIQEFTFGHDDHDITNEMRLWLLGGFRELLDPDASREATFEFPIPLAMGVLPCAMYGPKMGDEPMTSDHIMWYPRKGRTCPSRLTKLPMRMSGTISGAYAWDHVRHSLDFYSVYGGPVAPREMGDLEHQSLECGVKLPEGAIAESWAFWREHALSVETLRG